jgi:hypothetical protein
VRGHLTGHLTSLDGHVVILAPAAHAHGKAVALALGEAGASVALVSLAVMRTRAQQVSDAGGRAVAVRANLLDPVSVRLAVAEIERELGPPASLVHVAPDHLPGWPESVDPGTAATIESLTGGTVVVLVEGDDAVGGVPTSYAAATGARGLRAAAIQVTPSTKPRVGALVVDALQPSRSA